MLSDSCGDAGRKRHHHHAIGLELILGKCALATIRFHCSAVWPFHEAAADAAALTQLQAAGMQVTSDPDRTTFFAAVQPVYARWRERLGVARIEQLHMSR